MDLANKAVISIWHSLQHYLSIIFGKKLNAVIVDRTFKLDKIILLYLLSINLLFLFENFINIMKIKSENMKENTK